MLAAVIRVKITALAAQWMAVDISVLAQPISPVSIARRVSMLLFFIVLP